MSGLSIPKAKLTRVISLGLVTALTLGIHYGWVFQPIFGQAHWIHALHGRFCYIPIVIAASWFGLRGGLITASVVSILVLPFIAGRDLEPHLYVAELVEILFYFAIAVLTGALVDREFFARRQQEEAQLQAERSQKLSLVGQMAASVAHEIKNPLTSIKGAADILTDDETSAADKEEFRGILQNEVRRIDGTVTEFLEFARPRETKLEPINLSEIIRTCVRQLEVQARAEKVSISGDIQNDVHINGDAEKIRQMTLNLLLNSVQASPSGGVVTVSLRQTAPNSARLQVEDSGDGIDEKHLSRVFDPFFTTKATGSGLGLAVVKSIVDAHGGEIRIENKRDHGLIARVDLPSIGE